MDRERGLTGGGRRGRRGAWLVVGVALLAVAILGWVNRMEVWTWIVGYRVMWLDADVRVVDVNGRGQAAVYRYVSGPDGSLLEAGIWSASERRFVRLEPGAETTPGVLPIAINSRGEPLALGVEAGTDLVRSAVVWRDSSIPVRIDAPNGRSIHPRALNDEAQVVGATLHVDEGGTVELSSGQRAFLWTEEGGFVDLHSQLDCPSSEATAINNRGWIVGWQSISGENPDVLSDPIRPFLWRDGERISLVDASESSPKAMAIDINDRGDVLIRAGMGTRDERYHVWSPGGGLQPIPAGPNGERGKALDIDAAGRLLIRGGMDDPTACLYHDGQFSSLPELIENGVTVYTTLGPAGWLAGHTFRETAGHDRVIRRFLLRLYR